jgi:hypothetical protein
LPHHLDLAAITAATAADAAAAAPAARHPIQHDRCAVTNA